LSKSNVELDEEELDYHHFLKCIVNITNIIFPNVPNAKYKILSFEEKLEFVLSVLTKMHRQQNKQGIKRDTFEKIKTEKSKVRLTTNTTPTDEATNTFSEFPLFDPSQPIIKQ